METIAPAEDPAPDQMIALRSLIAMIGRNRRIWLMTGLVGLLIGATLHLVIPHKYTAVTDLYLAEPADSDPLQAMAGNVSLLQTEAVAREAVSLGNIHTTPSALQSHYIGLAVSGNLMSITFSGSSQAAAVSGASAVAHAYLAVQAQELRLQTNALVGGLQSQISSVNSAVDTLSASINRLSDASPNDETTNQIADLVNERSADETQVSQLQAQVEQAHLSQQSSDQISRVLDPAALVPVSTKKVTLVDALSGLVAGLALGMIAVIFNSLFSRRSPGRSTVASTLGAPVELSLGRYRLRRAWHRTKVPVLLRHPDATLLMIHRRLRRHLESAPGSTLAVIAEGSSDLTALAVGSLAFSLSSEGHRVVVVDAIANRPLARMLGLVTRPDAMDAFQLPVTEGPPLSVLVAPEDPLQMADKPPPESTDILLVLASLDASFGADHLSAWVTDAVMILSSRRITVPRMNVNREMLQEAGILLRAVILSDSDSQDETSGASSLTDARPDLSDAVESSK
jgi:capsular polysaccharide biosynthesis protein